MRTLIIDDAKAMRIILKQIIDSLFQYEMILNRVRVLFLMRNAHHHERHTNQDHRTRLSIPPRGWSH